MKITVELSETDLKDVCRLTGEKQKGTAIRKMVVDALMLKRRAEIAQKFIDGKNKAKLAGFEEGRAQDREKARKLNGKWRG